MVEWTKDATHGVMGETDLMDRGRALTTGTTFLAAFSFE